LLYDLAKKLISYMLLLLDSMLSGYHLYVSDSQQKNHPGSQVQSRHIFLRFEA
jgi:hypothetical protein